MSQELQAVLNKSPLEINQHYLENRKYGNASDVYTATDVLSAISSVGIPIVGCPVILSNNGAQVFDRAKFSSGESTLVNQQMLGGQSAYIIKLFQLPLIADHCIIAGGYVVSVLLGMSHSKLEGLDVDMFVYGTAEECSDIVRKVIEILYNESLDRVNYYNRHAHFKKKHVFRTVHTKWLTQIYFGDDRQQFELQIIQRLYSNPIDCIRGFDLASSQVFYGKYNGSMSVMMTGTAAWAFYHMGQPVCPEAASTTYERRLEKMRRRGFSIYLPELDTTKLQAGSAVRFAGVTMLVDQVRDNHIIGCFDCDVADSSDYEQKVDAHVSDQQIIRTNARSLVKAYLKKSSPAVIRSEYCSGDSTAKVTSSIYDLGVYYCKSSVLCANTLVNFSHLGSLVKGNNSVENVANFMSTCASYGLLANSEMVNMFSVLLGNPNEQDTLKRLEDTVLYMLTDAFTKAANYAKECKLWKVVDPAEQCTASIEARHTTPAEWYGEYHGTPAVYSEGDIAIQMIKFLAPEKFKHASKYNSENCSICLQGIGENDIAVAPCGHVLHLTCYVRMHNNRCPLCRDNLGRRAVAPACYLRPSSYTARLMITVNERIAAESAAPVPVPAQAAEVLPVIP
jgi:hypothetical protein